MDNRQYFEAAERENRDKWLCADSWLEQSADPQKKLRGEANFIIQVVSGKDSSTFVNLGDSFTTRTADNFGQDASITVTSTISGVTYQEFLAQSESEPFIVGRTMIISTTEGQVENPVVIAHRNANGDRVDHVITPTIDPYQNQTDRIIDDYEYLFDGMTRFRFSINGRATVSIRLYLINKWAATQAIAGRPAIQNYRPPHLIKAAY